MCTLCVVADCGAEAGNKSRKSRILKGKTLSFAKKRTIKNSFCSRASTKIENMRIYIRITSIPNVP